MTTTEITFLEDLADAQVTFVDKISTQIWMSDPNLLSVRKTKITLLESMIEIINYWFRDNVSLIRRFTNESFDTFVSSGTGISSAIVISGPSPIIGYAAHSNKNLFHVTKEDEIRVVVNEFLQNSGVAPSIFLCDSTQSLSDASSLVDGCNEFILTVHTSSEIAYLTIIVDDDTNFSLDSIKVTYTDNAVLTNSFFTVTEIQDVIDHANKIMGTSLYIDLSIY